MKSYLLSGSSGFIGSQVAAHLRKAGRQVTALVRSRRQAALGAIYWEAPKEVIFPSQALFHGVIHLAGESIVGRWSEEKKRRIYESRVLGTRALCLSLAALKKRPDVLICASAAGFYRRTDNEDNEAGEDTPCGDTFLAKVARDWEAACQPARDAGIRVVNLRMSAILSPQGGLLGKMVPLFRLGLGARLGHGRQLLSWLSMQDLLSIIEFCLNNNAIQGPLNASTPNPVSNADLTSLLAAALKRPALFTVPAWLLRFLFGQMADEVLLASSRIRPAKLLAAGFNFQHPLLEEYFSTLNLKPQQSQ